MIPFPVTAIVNQLQLQFLWIPGVNLYISFNQQFAQYKSDDVFKFYNHLFNPSLIFKFSKAP